VIAEARSALMGCQTIASEKYAALEPEKAALDLAAVKTDGAKLAEVPEANIKVLTITPKSSKITAMEYESDGYKAAYAKATDAKGTWTVTKLP
ncbi:MAG: hypothetical protein RSD97_07405, partial [Lachnospiraceae bacterium]